MRLSERGLAALCALEGFRARPYRDVAGQMTVGYGHLMTRPEVLTGKIRIGMDYVSLRDGRGLSEAEGRALLAQDVAVAERAVTDWVMMPLGVREADALIIFTYNVGAGAFGKSTLLKKLNAGEYKAVPEQLRRWVYAGGEWCEGLENRREAEIKIWQGEYA